MAASNVLSGATSREKREAMIRRDYLLNPVFS
jgi:hypothetical protein